jgi:hypothetical protein
MRVIAPTAPMAASNWLDALAKAISPVNFDFMVKSLGYLGQVQLS